MFNNNELLERIEIVRKTMHRMYISTHFSNDEILDISQYLDTLLNEYEKQKSIINQ